MALHPVGPLPAATYWRRRATILLAAVVVLLLARSCLGGSGSGSPRAHGQPTPTTSPTTRSTTPAGGAPSACPDSALKAEASTDQSTYPVGGRPRFTLVVANTSSSACTRDMGSGAVEFTVFSGTDRVWSSDDCGSSQGTAVVTLAPGARKEVTFTWTGKRSKPQCGGAHEEAKPGTYRVVGRAGTLHSSGAVFRFHA